MKIKNWMSAAAGFLFAAQLLGGCAKPSADALKVVSQKTVELGEPVSLNAQDYLLEGADSAVLEEITVESALKTDSKYTYNDFSKTAVSAGKNYLETGTYTITLNYQGQKYPVTITVKDTVMPEFISPAAVVTIPVGTEDFDFNKIYRTSDKDEVELSVEGEYDLDTVGTYPVTLIAKDKSGNTNSIEITINVVGKNQPITITDQFDDEVVPGASEEEEPDTTVPDSQSPVQSVQPADPVVPDEEDSTSQLPDNPPKACAIPNAPAGAQIYYNFSDLYNAGTAWNQANPNSNYFFYMEGKDDCGNTVYFLTTGSSETAAPQTDGSQNQAAVPQAQNDAAKSEASSAA